jgi:Tfp pilus assembly protein FimT
MLESITFTGKELLLAVVLASVVYLIEVLLFSRKRGKSASGQLAASVEEVKRSLELINARLEVLESRPPAESALDKQSNTHAEAIRMAREGSSAQEIANQLGLSRTETDLIIALHQSDP